MSMIIAGRFQLQDEVDRARSALVEAGFEADRISGFYLSQPGQHDVTPIGGDNLQSPGAKDTPEGVVQGMATGGAVGVAVGAATSPITGPIGPIVGGLVGGHIGSLFSFSKMKDRGEPEEGGENMVEPRVPGMMIAVALPDGDEARAIDVLRNLGAQRIERAQGTITAGDWKDFDPLSLPQYI